MKGPTQIEMRRYVTMAVLHAFRTAHNLLTSEASAVAFGLHGTRAMVKQPDTVPAIRFRLCHGAVGGATRP